MARTLLAASYVVAMACLGLSACGPVASRMPPCVQQTFEASAFTVCALRRDRDTFQLIRMSASDERVRRLRDLAASLPRGEVRRIRFAMNAGMFGADGAPLGLYVEDGALLHPGNFGSGEGNFFLKPNGVFSVDANGDIHVETMEAYLARAPAPHWATQSGPMLVIGGAIHPALGQDGPSRHVRNGVGACDGEAVFVISDEEVSFGRFARFFRDGLHCADALYLDGAVSSVWIPEMGRMDDGYDLGPVLVVSGE